MARAPLRKSGGPSIGSSCVPSFATAKLVHLAVVDLLVRAVPAVVGVGEAELGAVRERHRGPVDAGVRGVVRRDVDVVARPAGAVRKVLEIMIERAVFHHHDDDRFDRDAVPVGGRRSLRVDRQSAGVEGARRTRGLRNRVARRSARRGRTAGRAPERGGRRKGHETRDERNGADFERAHGVAL